MENNNQLNQNKMNPEQQRIKIAEACGWRPCGCGNARCTLFEMPDSTKRDPLIDLSAMHEAEKIAQNSLMNADQWSEYGQQLMRLHPTASLSVPVTDESDLYYEIASISTATAAQRAEAFLKTLNLWTDNES